MICSLTEHGKAVAQCDHIERELNDTIEEMEKIRTQMKETEQRLADANKVLKEYEENCDIVTTTIGK